MSNIRYYLRSLLVFMTAVICVSQVSGQGQIRSRINSVKTADPFAISGSVGAGLGTSYNSNFPGSTPFSANIYANINLSFYSFELPFSFYLVNNTTSFTYPQLPSFHLGFMPTYKNWKFHIGNSSMHFSNYTYSGLTFFGLGTEYSGDLFRMGVFAGTLQHATRRKGFDNRSAIQQLADSLMGLNVPEGDLPKYRREALGFKIGVGNERNFVDFSVLKAKDRIKTLPEEWRDTIAPHDNLVVGLSGRFAIKRWFAFTANLGASLHNPDTRDTMTSMISANEGYKTLQKYTNWLFALGNQVNLRFAGDASMNFMTKVFNGSITYRFIQPDYVSLGAANFNQNSHNLGTVMNFSMFKGKSNLNLVGYVQRDNLDKKQMFTNQVITYSVNWSNSIGNIFNMGIQYNGIKQDQFSGTSRINDTLKLNQIVHTLSATPTFTIERGHSHSIGLNFNFVQNKNLNKLNPNGVDVKTLTAGIIYGIDFEEIRLGVDAGYDYSISSSSFSHYNSHGLNAGLRYKIFKKEKIDWNLNYNGHVAYNIQKDEGVDNDFSLSNSLGSSFNYNNAHSASLYFSISNFSDLERIGQRVRTSLDCRFTLSYTYSFAARVIKRKTKDQREKERITREAAKLQKQNNKTR